MANRYVSTQTGIWADPDLAKWSNYAMLLYIYLYSNDHVDGITGIGRVEHGLVLHETRLTPKQFERAKEEIDTRVEWFPDGTHWVVGRAKHTCYTKDRVTVQKKRAAHAREFVSGIDSADARDIQQRFAARYPDVMDTVSIPYPYPTDTVSIPYPADPPVSVSVSVDVKEKKRPPVSPPATATSKTVNALEQAIQRTAPGRHTDDPLAYLEVSEEERQMAIRIFKHWQDVWKKGGATFTPTAANAIMARLREHCLEPCLLVVDKSHKLFLAGNAFYGDNCAVTMLFGPKIFDKVLQAAEPESEGQHTRRIVAEARAKEAERGRRND